MSNRIKLLVEAIRKNAQDAPHRRVPKGGKPTDTTPRRGVPRDTPVASPAAPPAAASNISIMTMQNALQDLARDVSAQINLQDAFSGDPKKEQEAKERDAFGVFLTKNYMRNTKVPGVEYDPDPKITDVSQKRPDDPTRMSVVMDTMNRVGTPKKGEEFVDGRWGPRTNAAVRNAYAFASGMFDFVDDVNRFSTRKLHIDSYNKESLKNLETMAKVDAGALTPQQKLESAPYVTQHVKAIRNMYDEIKNQILQHPTYQQFIEGNVPFKSYEPKVTKQQIESLKKNFPQGIDLSFKNVKANIGIDDLSSLDALKNWIGRAVPTINPSPQEVVSQVWKQHEKLLGPDPGF